ncbi:diflavin oxidoreductase [Mycolicibacterium sp.]|uniref:diflavin oxidoreductase n=1 Tax=Mycolicibacterium sp. TaxID=2320850 RepID=UPI003D0AF5F5
MPGNAACDLVLGFATETGNAAMVAKTLAQAARGVGFDLEPTPLNDVSMDRLASATHLIVITSTYGDGEMPYDAEVFWEELSSEDAGRLDRLGFAVLGLGDSFYPYFCNAGKLIDTRLGELGATRLLGRVDCDLEFEEPAEAWTADVVKLLADLGGTAAPTAGDAEVVAQQDSRWTRRNPFPARLTRSRELTAAGSDKSVRHYEIDLGDSGITYQAGDSLGVHPVNHPTLVAALLERLGVSADHVVGDRPLGVLLTEDLEIRVPTGALQSLVASRTSDTEAATILSGADPAALTRWLYGRDVLDLLELADLDVDEVVPTLRPLQHRDYSIASSPLLHPGSIHLTVATVDYQLGGRRRRGVASGFLAEHTDEVRIHLAPNDSFRLPAPDVPIVMVGPGTGIAPFRAFLQERQATGATGRSWLFFGDRHRATDFLYRDELEAFRDAGVLTRLDTAFSRDQAVKDYVQHHMLAHAGELYGWLQDGAYLYVCGDAEHMAKDVHRALHEVVATAGGLDAERAHAYVNDLVTSHRYLRDVY